MTTLFPDTPKSALLAFILLAVPAASQAKAPVPDKSWPKVECASFAKLNSEIQYCSENTKAVAYAEECAKKLTDAWEQAASDLKALQKSSGSQQAGFQSSSSKYRNTIDRMAYLTGQLVRSADLIASYPNAMVDNSAAKSQSDSFPCYQQAFQKIQKVVSDLDRRSHEGVQALVATSALEENVIARSEDIESDSLVKSVSSDPKTEGRTPASKRHKRDASDITGTQKKKSRL